MKVFLDIRRWKCSDNFGMFKQILAVFLFLIIATAITFAQSKSNDVIAKQIKDAGAEKSITLRYDSAGNSSKVMFFSEDFGKNQYENLGLKTFTFGMAFFYAGKTLTAPPQTVNLTFWIQTKKPKFTDAHNVVLTSGAETFDLGEARYFSKPNENMEYLNFVIPYETLKKLSGGTNQTVKIGTSEFKFTPAQLKSVANYIKISDPNAQ